MGEELIRAGGGGGLGGWMLCTICLGMGWLPVAYELFSLSIYIWGG